jgi:hypothetical protein
MSQRIVFWAPPKELFPYDFRPTSLNLDPAVLQQEYPKLAEQIGNGKVVSHNLAWVGGGAVNWIVSFTVED